MFIRRDWSAPFVGDVEIVRSCAALNRTAIVAIAAANQVALIRREWFDRASMLIDSLAKRVVRIRRSIRHPLTGRR